MYPPSMLSSAALAHSAQELEKRSLCRQFNVNQLITRLQLLTRVENVSLHHTIVLSPQCWSSVLVLSAGLGLMMTVVSV